MLYYKQIEYFPDGTIKFERKDYNNSNLNGLITHFYNNGKLKEIICYKDGEKDGRYLKYNEQGILIIDGKWKKDKPIGHWKYYNDIGILIEIKKINRL